MEVEPVLTRMPPTQRWRVGRVDGIAPAANRYRPDIPQPFTMWLYPWPAILSGALWLFIFFTGPWEGIVFSVLFLFTGIAAYGLFVRSKG